MPSTRIPARRATSACASSWASSEAKNRIAMPVPATQYATTGRPGALAGRMLVARPAARSHAMSRTLQWIPSRIPNGEPSRTLSFMAPWSAASVRRG